MFDVLLPRFKEVSGDKLELKVVLVAFPFLGEVKPISFVFSVVVHQS